MDFTNGCYGVYMQHWLRSLVIEGLLVLGFLAVPAGIAGGIGITVCCCRSRADLSEQLEMGQPMQS